MKKMIITCALITVASIVSCTDSTQTTQKKSEQKDAIADNAEKANKDYSGNKNLASLDCKKIITDADAQALGFDRVEETTHSDYMHDFKVKEKSGQIMATFGIVQSGTDGYKGGLDGAKMLGQGQKIGNQEVKSTFTEENKYGDKSYLEIAPWTNVVIGVLKGKYYIEIKAYKRSNQTIEQATEVAKKLAETCIKRMP